MTAARTLPFPDDSDWHWRWLQAPSARAVTLHRVVAYDAMDEETWVPVRLVDATMVCGRRFPWAGMPGVLSRLGSPRCKSCCKRLGITAGFGAPFNAKPRIIEPAEVAA